MEAAGVFLDIVFLLVWASLLSRTSKRKLGSVLLGLAIGTVFVTLVVFGLESCLRGIVEMRVAEYQAKIIIAPIVEELTKLLFISVFAWKSRTVLSEVLTFGAAVGLGFGFFETLGMTSDIANVILRNLSTVPMHMLSPFFTSYGVKKLFEKRNPVWMIGSVLLAIAIHSCFNFVILYLGYG
jgi:RsiW-degrading membrane proteinase PrsW (M82 family)